MGQAGGRCGIARDVGVLVREGQEPPAMFRGHPTVRIVAEVADMGLPDDQFAVGDIGAAVVIPTVGVGLGQVHDSCCARRHAGPRAPRDRRRGSRCRRGRRPKSRSRRPPAIPGSPHARCRRGPDAIGRSAMARAPARRRNRWRTSAASRLRRWGGPDGERRASAVRRAPSSPSYAGNVEIGSTVERW